MQNILVPTDLNDESLSAVEIAQLLAKQFNATIHLLHVVDRGETVGEPGETEDLLAVRTEQAALQLRKFVYWKLNDRGNVIPVTIPGRPPEKIVQYAMQQQVDLIVIATHLGKRQSRHLVGSIAEEVIRLSDIPVLTVKVRSAGESIEHPSDAWPEAMPV